MNCVSRFIEPITTVTKTVKVQNYFEFIFNDLKTNKFFEPHCFVTKTILDSKYFGSQDPFKLKLFIFLIFFLPILFGTNKSCEPAIFWTKNICWLNTLWIKNVLHSKVFWDLKFLDQIFILESHFLFQNFLGSWIFLGSCYSP